MPVCREITSYRVSRMPETVLPRKPGRSAGREIWTTSSSGSTPKVWGSMPARDRVGRNCTAGMYLSETNILIGAANTRRKKSARDMGRRSLQGSHRNVAAPPRHKLGEILNCHNLREAGNSQPPVMYSRNPEAPGGDGSGAYKRLRRHASRSNRQSGDGAGTSCNQGRNRPARLPGPVPASGKRT